MKVVKNVCFGGFGLSNAAIERLVELTGKSERDCYRDYNLEENRAAPELVQVVEELGEKSWGSFAQLVVVEIPDDVEWYISEDDGWETIEEVHRFW